MAIPQEDRAAYFLRHVPGGTYEDRDTWWSDFDYFVKQGELPDTSPYYNVNDPTSIDTGYTMESYQQDRGQYSSTGITSEADQILADRNVDNSLSTLAGINEALLPYSRDAYMHGMGSTSGDMLTVDEARADPSAFYGQAFGVKGPGQYGDVRGGFYDITSPADMEAAYTSFLETGDFPRAEYSDIRFGQQSGTPTYLAQYTDQYINDAQTRGVSGRGTNEMYARNPIQYGQIVNAEGGAAAPTYVPTPGYYDENGQYMTQQGSPISGTSSVGTMRDPFLNNYVPGGSDDPNLAEADLGTAYSSGLGNATVPTGTSGVTGTTGTSVTGGQYGGSMATGNVLGGLQDLGSYVPSEIRTGSAEQVAADVYSNEVALAEIGRRQQRGDVLGTTEQWAGAEELRAAEARDYTRDYQQGLDTRLADYQQGLDTRRGEYEQGLSDVYDPYSTRGTAADQEAMALAGSDLNVDVTQDPGYQFRMKESQKALERQQAAGAGAGGGALKEMARYMQGLASQEYGAAYDRTSKLRTERLGMLSDLGTRGYSAADRRGVLMTNPAEYLQNTAGNLQNLAPLTADYGQMYSSRLGGLTGVEQSYTSGLSGALEGMGANQAQIIANDQARRDAEAAGRRSTTNAILAGGLSAISDPRTKENIVQVGRLSNGLPWYEYNYIGDSVRVRGSMSTDVKKIMPEAVRMNEDGYEYVMYGMLLGEH